MRPPSCSTGQIVKPLNFWRIGLKVLKQANALRTVICESFQHMRV